MFLTYFLHLFFEGIAAVGGYYARSFCKHTWHRVLVAVVWSMITTLVLINMVG